MGEFLMERIREKLGHGWPFDVTKKDLKIEPTRGTGPGGQKRNKTFSGIRIIHLPTGISVRSDEFKSQKQNLSAS